MERNGIDLDALVGELADIEVIHRAGNAPHQEALRMVNDVYPPGQLVNPVWSTN